MGSINQAAEEPAVRENMLGTAILFLPLVVSAVLGQSNFRCPEKDGYFEDQQQCDKYYDCLDAIPEERLCPDGLVFDPFSRKREPCDHYFNVDCGDRLELQPARGPSDLCPRLNGVCNWPEVTDRQECKADAYETASGFSCPEKPDSDEFGQVDPHPKFADPDDCAKFFICLNNISPREQGCELGLVFNETTLQCDAPENVPECKDYYAFLDEDKPESRRRK